MFSKKNVYCVLAVVDIPLQLLNTRITITMTVSEVVIIKATATTPPIMAEVSVSELELSAWKTSVAGTKQK